MLHVGIPFQSYYSKFRNGEGTTSVAIKVREKFPQIHLFRPGRIYACRLGNTHAAALRCCLVGRCRCSLLHKNVLVGRFAITTLGTTTFNIEVAKTLINYGPSWPNVFFVFLIITSEFLMGQPFNPFFAQTAKQFC